MQKNLEPRASQVKLWPDLTIIDIPGAVDAHATTTQGGPQQIVGMSKPQAAGLALNLLTAAAPTITVDTSNPYIPHRIYAEGEARPWNTLAEVTTRDFVGDRMQPVMKVRCGLGTFEGESGMKDLLEYVVALFTAVNIAEREYAAATTEETARLTEK